MKKTVEIWYLYHSGFAVKLNKKLLIFDYFSNQAANNGPSLYNGVFNPDDFKDHEVFIFASHRHHDHFNPIILEWMNQYPNIRLILSSDIIGYKPHPNILVAQPEKKYAFNNMYIETFTSTDEGTAFLVKTDETCLFHAGDLHWWHWEGEPHSFNKQMESQFKAQIQKLSEHSVDIAFLVVDPRQEKHSLLGLNWFLKEIKCTHVFPMHFSDDYSIMDTILKFKESAQYRANIHLIDKRGQRFLIEL